MAKLYPHPLPTYVRENPLRSAECRIYDRLASELTDDFTVFYSRPWLGLSGDGREIDGEADFVVAHPEFGILVLEVKGGAVARNAATDEWTSIDRRGWKHRIKNPVRQARNSKYRILEKLKEVPFWDSRFVRLRHGVVLPDSADPGADLGADMPRQIFAFAEDVKGFGGWVRNRLEPSREDPATSERFEPLGRKGLEALVHVLARSFELRTPLASVLEVEDERISVMTEQQYHVLEYLERAPRCAVEGGAGSGKTVLAAELAFRLSSSGVRTLLTCYNRPLADHLKRAHSEVPGLDVQSFHQFCGWMLAQAGHELPGSGQGSILDMDDKQLAEVLVASLEAALGEPFEAIVVDEAQDFPDDWLTALQLCLADPAEGHFHLFFDNNQRLRGPDLIGRRGEEVPPFPLSRNLRNSRQIFSLTERYYRGGAYVGAGPDGREVEFIPTDGPEEMVDRLIGLLGRLTRTERMEAGDVSVLASERSLFSPTMRARLERHYDLVDASQIGQGGLVVDTARRFKGLESRALILLASELLLDEPELAYVAFSRARLHLSVIGPGPVLAALQKGPPG